MAVSYTHLGVNALGIIKLGGIVVKERVSFCSQPTLLIKVASTKMISSLALKTIDVPLPGTDWPFTVHVTGVGSGVANSVTVTSEPCIVLSVIGTRKRFDSSPP